MRHAQVDRCCHSGQRHQRETIDHSPHNHLFYSEIVHLYKLSVNTNETVTCLVPFLFHPIEIQTVNSFSFSFLLVFSIVTTSAGYMVYLKLVLITLLGIKPLCPVW